MKGISPLVASVLLIAITMAVAAILANYVSTLTTETLGNLPTCIGGSVNFASADYPKWDDSTSSIVAVVEAQSVSLGRFKFAVTLSNDTVATFDDTRGQAIPAGAIGDIRTQNSLPFAETDVRTVTVLTNCSNVKAGPTGLR